MMALTSTITPIEGRGGKVEGVDGGEKTLWNGADLGAGGVPIGNLANLCLLLRVHKSPSGSSGEGLKYWLVDHLIWNRVY